MQATKILVSIQIVDDNDSLMYLFAIVTGLFEWLHRLALTITDEINIAVEAVSVTAKIVTIVIKSIAFGIGLRL